MKYCKVCNQPIEKGQFCSLDCRNDWVFIRRKEQGESECKLYDKRRKCHFWQESPTFCRKCTYEIELTIQE